MAEPDDPTGVLDALRWAREEWMRRGWTDAALSLDPHIERVGEPDLLGRALALLRERVDEGGQPRHAWDYICRYCGRCSDYELEHDDDCPLLALEAEARERSE